MTLLYCTAICHSTQLSHLPSALVSRCAFSQVTFCCQLQDSWHFKMSLPRALWSTSGFHKKHCWSPLQDLLFVAAKGIVRPAFSRQLPRKFQSFAVLSPSSLPASQFPASFTSEWRIQMVHSVCLLFCSSLDLHVQYSSIHLYNASTVS